MTDYPRAYAYLRGDWFWVHQSCPYSLRPYLGRLCWQYSLDTKDKEEAEAKVAVYQKHFDGLIRNAQIRHSYLNLEMDKTERLLEVISHD